MIFATMAAMQLGFTVTLGLCRYLVFVEVCLHGCEVLLFLLSPSRRGGDHDLHWNPRHNKHFRPLHRMLLPVDVEQVT